MVVGLIAGGHAALTRAVEGAEDDPRQGAADLAALGRRRRTTWSSGSPRRAERRTCSGRWTRREDVGATTVGTGLQPPEPARRARRPRDRPAGRPRGHRRLDPAQGGDGDQADPEHDHHRRDGPDRQDARQPDDRPPADEREAPPADRGGSSASWPGIDDDEAAALLAQTSGRLKPALVAALAGVDAARADALLVEHGGQVRAAVRAVDRSVAPMSGPTDPRHRRRRHRHDGLAGRRRRQRPGPGQVRAVEHQGRRRRRRARRAGPSILAAFHDAGVPVGPVEVVVPRPGRVRPARDKEWLRSWASESAWARRLVLVNDGDLVVAAGRPRAGASA